MPSYKQEEPKSSGTFFVEPGIYQIDVRNAIEKVSDNGNDMIKIICKVILPDGGVGPEIHDYLVFTAKAAWKIDQFLASIGQAVVPGEEVTVNAIDLVGQTGLALIGEEPGQKNPQHRFNTIERWVFGDERAEWISKNRKPSSAVQAVKKSEPPKKAAKVEENEQDIPF